MFLYLFCKRIVNYDDVYYDYNVVGGTIQNVTISQFLAYIYAVRFGCSLPILQHRLSFNSFK